MRGFYFAPMIKKLKKYLNKNDGAACLTRRICIVIIIIINLTGCAASGGLNQNKNQDDPRMKYLEMSGCTMQAVISCEQDGILWRSELKCEYVPDGVCEIEILSPENIAGVRAVLDLNSEKWDLRYEGAVLDAGTLGQESISPAAALPRLMDALRNGWLSDENAENLNQVPCTRMTFDQDGTRTDKIYSTIWIRRDDNKPIKGEIMTDNQVILTIEFIDFDFN